MECPHCHEEISGKTCSHCQKSIPQESLFCMYCGQAWREEAVGASEQGDPFDLDSRVLCPDGTCTGIIVNGVCTECGKRPEEVDAEENPPPPAPDPPEEDKPTE